MKFIVFIFGLIFCSPCFCDDKPPSKVKVAPKNLILIIGDGMGPQQLSLLLLYNDFVKSRGDQPLNIEHFVKNATSGLLYPKPESALVTESACSATEIASGEQGTLEGLGINRKGEKLETILEKSKKMGKAVGLITDTRLTHATPAAFVAHTPHRDREAEIARELLSSKTDLMLGGGARFFPSELSDYNIATNLEELNEVRDLPLLGLFTQDVMPDGIKEYRTRDEPSRSIPNLREMLGKSLGLLSKSKNGFFLMIEAGLIDWAGHRNDAGQLLYEMIKLDSVLGEALKWVKNRDDTLIILAADHETGSFGFSYKASEVGTPLFIPDPQGARNKWKPPIDYIDNNIFELLLKQKKTLLEVMREIEDSSDAEDMSRSTRRILTENLPYYFDQESLKLITEKEKIPKHFNPNTTSEWSSISDFDAFYPDYSDRLSAHLSRLIAEQQGVVWGTGGHTATLVPVLAFGKKDWQEKFTGIYSTKELGSRMDDLFLGKE